MDKQTAFFQLYADANDAQLRMEAAGIDPAKTEPGNLEDDCYLGVLNLQLRLKRLFAEWMREAPTEKRQEIYDVTVATPARELARKLLEQYHNKRPQRIVRVKFGTSPSPADQHICYVVMTEEQEKSMFEHMEICNHVWTIHNDWDCGPAPLPTAVSYEDFLKAHPYLTPTEVPE